MRFRISIIEIKKLGYSLPNGKRLFSGLTESFGPERTAIIGPNGIGKSTFLKIIAGKTKEFDGSLQGVEHIGYMPQDVVLDPDVIVAFAMGVEANYRACQRMEAGEASEDDIEKAAEHWEIIGDAEKILSTYGYSGLDLGSKVNILSGGQLTQIVLLGVLITKPTHLILDEPTNHLDGEAKAWLKKIILDFKGGVILVSHDRALLEEVDRIIELSSGGMTAYGGAYSEYKAQKDIAVAAFERDLIVAEKNLKSAKKDAQKERERSEKRAASGRKKGVKTGMSRLEVGAAKEQASKSSERSSALSSKLLDEAMMSAKTAKANIEQRKSFSINMTDFGETRGRLLLKLEGVSFGYEVQKLLFKGISFELEEGDRIALMGPNGSGKTSLFKIIMGHLDETSGTLDNRARNVAYLDQSCSAVLNFNETVLENFQRSNPSVSIVDARNILASFLFRGDDALKEVNCLSGGEIMRAAIVCLLAGDTPPDLILLDEPTNNLDLESVERLEEALRDYQGGILVVSHDQEFLKAINISETVVLD